MDKEGFLWVEDRGRFTRIHMVSGKTHQVVAEPGLQRLAQNTSTHYTDPSGVIWMPTSGFGMLKYHPARDCFHHISRGNNTYQILPVGGDNMMINGRYLLRTRSLGYEVPQDKLFRDWAADFDRSAVNAGQKAVWINGESGLAKVNWSGRVLENIAFDKGKLFPLFSGDDKLIWAGSDSLLVRFDPRERKLRSYPIPARPRVAGYSFVQQIWQDTDKTLWLATVSGLLHFNPAREQWRVYQYEREMHTH